MTDTFATLAAAAKSKRSTLYAWMLENFDRFKAVLAETTRPNWVALAEAFAAQGLRDAEDKPASPEVVRQTWWRVRKAMDARARSRSTKRQTLAKPTPMQTPQPPQKEQPADVSHPKRGFSFDPTIKASDEERLWRKPGKKDE